MSLGAWRGRGDTLMMGAMTTVHPVPPSAADPFGGMPPVDVAALERWFDQLADAQVHPDLVARQLRHEGWPEHAVVWASTRYRNRWSTHPGIWWGGFTAVGFSALSWAGVVHSVIDGVGTAAAAWFGIAVVATAFAVVAAVQIHRIEHHWSQSFSVSRRAAASTLFWFTVFVAVVRGVGYGTALGLAIFDGRSGLLGSALAHIVLTGAIAGPLGWWIWTCHRSRTDAPGSDERLADDAYTPEWSAGSTGQAR